MENNLPRVMIAGTNSGCGKTSVVCALLRAFQKKGVKVNAFKCGPDYIDPMFHSKIIGIAARNIDYFLCGDAASDCFKINANGAQLNIIEGVMGYYDGIAGTSAENSTHDIAMRLKTPTILVVNCKGAMLSVAATVKGFCDLYKNNIVGVILNNVSQAMLPLYKEIIELHTDVKVLGCLPTEKSAVIKSRHLGLVTAQEIDDLQQKIDKLAELASENIDLDEILQIAKSAKALNAPNEIEKQAPSVKIAVAKDEAFCFYYEDSLDMLKSYGAEIVYFSPLKDSVLPTGIGGIFLGGGYPELYLKKLSENKTMLKSIKDAHEKNMPIYAECGGFMYLGSSIGGFKMCDVIKMESVMTEKLQNFGYVKLIADEDNMLVKKGEEVAAHEFHYSKSNLKEDEKALTAIKKSGKKWRSAYIKESLFALYPHIHFVGCSHIAKRFVAGCEKYTDN